MTDAVPAEVDLGQVFQRLQSLLLSLEDVQLFLDGVAVLTAALSSADVASGITVRRDGLPMTVASSDERAAALDESQYLTDEGPCLQSLRTGRAVEISDVRAERRWPEYLATARENGLRCSLSLALHAGEVTFGALNVYGFDRPDLFTPDLRDRLARYAEQVSGSLRLATVRADKLVLQTQLEAALSSRSIIDQALGIVMAERRCDADRAFTHLRQRSQDRSQPLRQVATEIVVRVGGRPPRLGRAFHSE